MLFHNDKSEAPENTKVPPSHVHGGEAGAIGGEVVGAVVGLMGGPAGAVAGMVLGAAAGALMGKILDEEGERTHHREEELDEVIGVTKGDLGGLPRRSA